MRAAALLMLVTVGVAVAAPVPKSLKKKPPAKPDGVWVLAEFSSDGVPPAPNPGMARDWVFEGEYIHIGAKSLPGQGNGPPNFTIYDPDRPTLRKWGTNMAAYELDADGDTLRACYAHDGRKELTECKPDKGIHYYVFTRAK